MLVHGFLDGFRILIVAIEQYEFELFMHVIETDNFELWLLIVLNAIDLGDEGVDDFLSGHFESIFREILSRTVLV